MNSFAFSIIRINTVKDPVRPWRLSGGAETGVKRNAAGKGSKYEAGEPLVELLASSIRNLLGTNSHTQRKIKADNFSCLTFPVLLPIDCSFA